MANARILRWDPTQPIFHWLAFGFRVGQILGFALAPRYQHVCIPNAKLWLRGYCPTPTPNARYFASQWNIGLTF